MKADLVFEGGGILGISFIGALKALREKGYRVERCAGTSAGAIVASLVMAGYSVEELYRVMKTTDYISLTKNSSYGRFPVGKELQLFLKKGLYDGDNLEKWIRPLLEAKKVTKFKQLMINGKSRLKIIASDITKRDMLVLPDDLVNYGIDPSEFEIAKAVRMSASIPLYFTPYTLKYPSGRSFIVDGGLLSNFPVWIFDVEGVPRWPTFGIKIKDKAGKTLQGKSCFPYFLMDLVTSPLYVNEERFVRNVDLVRTIVLEHPKLKATDFKLAKACAEDLFSLGYKNTVDFLKHWDFQRYIREYRGKGTFQLTL